jgi:hypothetical protein
MNRAISRRRLINQRLTGSRCRTVREVVAHMGGIQAQDHAGGMWSIGLRLPGSTIADIDHAIAGGSVVRTWAMRGTLHMVAAKDIRWILGLLSQEIIAGSALRTRQLGLETPTLVRSEHIITKVLEGGKQRTRNELVEALEARGIDCRGQRAAHIVRRASLDRLICFGVRRNKQFTYALFDEWVSRTKPMQHDEALAELARRYFRSHGPATVQDFIWWSGLPAADAKRGLEMIKQGLDEQVVDERTYWMNPESGRSGTKFLGAYLLSGFDDYLLGYRDRSASLDPKYAPRLGAGGILNPSIIIDGEVVGTWRRRFSRGRVFVETRTFTQINKRQKEALAAADAEYKRFLGPIVPRSPTG